MLRTCQIFSIVEDVAAQREAMILLCISAQNHVNFSLIQLMGWVVSQLAKTAREIRGGDDFVVINDASAHMREMMKSIVQAV